MRIDVRRGTDRFVTRTESIESRHSFSFGPHYDPGNTRFGPLVAFNDETLQAGAGFPDHPHRDVDIVTWVVEGAVEHRDDAGHTALARPGVAQLLSAGDGVRHAEVNAASAVTRFVQAWIMPEAAGPACYQQADVGDGLRGGGLVVVASGGPVAPLRLRNAGATLMVGRLPGGGIAGVPVTPRAHLYVVRGRVDFGDDRLDAGDAARIREVEEGAEIVAASDAEVLVWVFGG